MGYSDKLTVTISCPHCGISEEQSAKDYGGGWGGPNWERLDAFTSFDVVDSHSEKRGPDVTSATCKKCGKAAKVAERYSQ